jgi:hypothetical protein
LKKTNKDDIKIKGEALRRYYKELPSNLAELANQEFFNKLSDFMNENTVGLKWREIIDTQKLMLVYTISLSLEEYSKYVDSKEREKLK